MCIAAVGHLFKLSASGLRLALVVRAKKLVRSSDGVVFLWGFSLVFAFVLFALVFSVLSCLVSGCLGSFSASAVRRRRAGRFPVWLLVFGLLLLLVPPLLGVVFCVVSWVVAS